MVGLACCNEGLGYDGGMVFINHPGRSNHTVKARPEPPDQVRSSIRPPPYFAFSLLHLSGWTTVDELGLDKDLYRLLLDLTPVPSGVR